MLTLDLIAAQYLQESRLFDQEWAGEQGSGIDDAGDSHPVHVDPCRSPGSSNSVDGEEKVACSLVETHATPAIASPQN